MLICHLKPIKPVWCGVVCCDIGHEEIMASVAKRRDICLKCKVLFVSWFCLTSQQHASVSQGRICADNCTCCHTEGEVADPTFYLTQSHYTDTGPTSPSADPVMPGAWQGVPIFNLVV